MDAVAVTGALEDLLFWIIALIVTGTVSFVTVRFIQQWMPTRTERRLLEQEAALLDRVADLEARLSELEYERARAIEPQVSRLDAERLSTPVP